MKKALFFDFDGVILDSFSMYSKKWIELGKKHDAPVPDEESFRELFDGNFYDRLLKRYPHLNGDTDIFKESVKLTLKYARELNMFPKMQSVIKNLSKDYELFIITSTYTQAVEDSLNKNNMKELFKEVFGAEKGLSKEDKFNKAIEKYNLNKEDIIFITDTLGDIKEANQLGIKSIGVSWGYQNKKTLEKGKPYKIVSVPEELTKVIKEQ